MTTIDKWNECTALGDTLDDQMMNMVADYVEAVAADLEMGVQIRGGVCYRQSRTLELHAVLSSGMRDNVDGCRRFHDQLCRAFNADNAGIDANRDIVWILRIKGASR